VPCGYMVALEGTKARMSRSPIPRPTSRFPAGPPALSRSGRPGLHPGRRRAKLRIRKGLRELLHGQDVERRVRNPGPSEGMELATTGPGAGSGSAAYEFIRRASAEGLSAFAADSKLFQIPLAYRGYS
jgi:hypothetical protein